MTKQQIKAKIIDIFDMNEYELIEFNQELNLNTIDAKSKMYMQIAIDDRLMSINTAKEFGNTECVCGELRVGGI